MDQEILVKFASELKIAEMQKTAWDWKDMAGALGLDALIGAGMGGAGAALTGTSIGAGLLGGALPFATNPLTAPIAAILGTAGVAYTIYNVMQQTDDNVEGLINRLEDLDPNKDAKNIVDSWINALKQYSSIFAIEVKEQDPIARAEQVKKQIQAATGLVDYLKGMKDQWPEVKSNLTDWGFDAGQAETALSKTLQSAEKGLAQIKQTAQQEGKKLVEQGKQKGGLNYSKLAARVMELHKQLTEAYGETPEYEGWEKPAFNLANNILEGKAEIQDINELGPTMNALVKVQEGALKRKKPAPKRSNFQANISKRAIKFSTDTKQPQATPAAKQEIAKPKVKDLDVVNLQQAINYLNLNLKTGVGRVAEDGNYGQSTVDALVGLIQKYPVIENYLNRKVGIGKDYLDDFELMKSNNSEHIKQTASLLAAVMREMKGEQAQSNSQPTQPLNQVRCREDKENPTPEEILACLRGRVIQDPQTEVNHNAYEYLKNRGMRDNDIVAMIIKLFRGSRSEDWDMRQIARQVSGPRYDVLRGY